MLNESDIKLIGEISGRSGECHSMPEFADAVLPCVTELFGSKSSLFYTYSDGPEQQFDDCFADNVDLSYCRHYQQHYHKHDPCHDLFKERQQKRLAASVSTDEAIEREHHYMASAYYEDFLRPQGIHRSLIFNIADETRSYGLFGVHRNRSSDDYQSDDHLLASLLTYQLTHSLKLMAERSRRKAEGCAASTLMERSNILGYLALDPAGRVAAISEGFSGLFDASPDLWVGGSAAPVQQFLSPRAGQYVESFLKRNPETPLFRDEVVLGGHTLPISLEVAEGQASNLALYVHTGSSTESISLSRMAQFDLTDKQQQVVRLVAKGLTNLQVADTLSISLKTLEKHMTAIYRKTGCHNKTGLVALLRA